MEDIYSLQLLPPPVMSEVAVKSVGIVERCQQTSPLLENTEHNDHHFKWRKCG
jgi:hypothetical protein